MPIVITTVLTHNQSQAVRLSTEACLPDQVKRVIVRICGHETIISPLKHTWDNFFLNGPSVSDDFMKERGE